VASIREDADQNPVVKLELTEEGRIVERTHDLVVLSLGMQPSFDPACIFGLPAATDGFVHIPEVNYAPCKTGRKGIFVTGTAMAPMDIVDSIMTASAAASEVSAYLREWDNGCAVHEPIEKGREIAYA